MSLNEKIKESKSNSLYVSKIDMYLENLDEQKLFKFGYWVLEESLVIIRLLASVEEKVSCLWIKRLTDGMHNIPIKLKEQDRTYLKEEIINTIIILAEIENDILFKGLPISPMKHAVEFLKN